jgi:hypothetical protein
MVEGIGPDLQSEIGVDRSICGDVQAQLEGTGRTGRQSRDEQGNELLSGVRGDGIVGLIPVGGQSGHRRRRAETEVLDAHLCSLRQVGEREPDGNGHGVDVSGVGDDELEGGLSSASEEVLEDAVDVGLVASDEVDSDLRFASRVDSEGFGHGVLRVVVEDEDDISVSGVCAPEVEGSQEGEGALSGEVFSGDIFGPIKVSEGDSGDVIGVAVDESDGDLSGLGAVASVGGHRKCNGGEETHI